MVDRNEIKYKKPKIMIIDMAESLVTNIRSNGFNVVSGTFGVPYVVPRNDSFLQTKLEYILPNLEEQDVIIIDLAPPDTITEAPEVSITPGTKTFYVKCDKGVIDPRPTSALIIRDQMNSIFENGGIFIIFSAFDYPQETDFGNIYEKSRLGEFTCWSFLSVLDNLDRNCSKGEEIIIIEENIDLFPFLRKYINGACFDTTFEVYGEFSQSWIPLLKNKHGKCVGGVIALKIGGLVIILPQLSKKEEILLRILKESLPEHRPGLFPDIEAGRWLMRDEYEFEEVKHLKSQIATIEKQAKEEIEILGEKIHQERERLNYLHGILTKTGTPLVNDMETSLRLIFNDIINVDKETPEGINLQEDLQIRDRATTILVEVKGVSGVPDESDITQLLKYMTRRMKVWDTTDIRGCFIVNHRRHIPPLERNNDTVFTEAQEKDSIGNQIALLTSWQIYKLLRGLQKWSWDRRKVQDIFYQEGRFSGVPPFYKSAGKIINYFSKVNVVGVEITSGKLRIGDRIGYITPLGYLEQDIKSMQVDNKNVVEADPGQGAGIETEYSKETLRDAKQVYLVNNKSED